LPTGAIRRASSSQVVTINTATPSFLQAKYPTYCAANNHSVQLKNTAPCTYPNHLLKHISMDFSFTE